MKKKKKKTFDVATLESARAFDVTLATVGVPVAARPYYIAGTSAFVRVPALRGFWWKTDRSVMVSCPACGSEEGVPCIGKTGYSSATHYKRRYKFHGRPF